LKVVDLALNQARQTLEKKQYLDPDWYHLWRLKSFRNCFWEQICHLKILLRKMIAKLGHSGFHLWISDFLYGKHGKLFLLAFISMVAASIP